MLALPSSSSTSTEKKCAVCYRSAHCNNYGTLSCDACKMFFRRIILLNIKYICERKSRCFENFEPDNPFPRCRACRFERCIECGMCPTKILKVNTQKYDDASALIRGLMYLDCRRINLLMTKFTFDNPSLEYVVKGGTMSLMSLEGVNYKKTEQDWRFFDIYTIVDFFLSLSFMGKLELKDQLILIQSFTAKAVLFFSSHRAMKLKNDKLLTPSGQETVPDVLQTACNFSYHFLCQIRSLLVSRLIELEITDEEFLLVAVVLFCNPAVSSLSDNAKSVVSKYQKDYSNALLQYCFVSSQKSAPSRFTDLLSLCSVINKNFEDVQNLTMIVKFHMPHSECKKIFDDIMRH